MKSREEREKEWRLGIAVGMISAGLALLFMGFWVVPVGEVDHTILIAFGEILTFVGALFGIEYATKERYRRGE